MKRSAPLKRKTPLKRTAFKRKKPDGRAPGSALRPLSPKRAEQQRQYLELRKQKLKETPICEFVTPGGNRCHNKAVDVHHKAGRGRHLCTYALFMSTCRHHHDWIHENGKAAEALGYVIRDRSPVNPLQPE